MGSKAIRYIQRRIHKNFGVLDLLDAYNEARKQDKELWGIVAYHGKAGLDELEHRTTVRRAVRFPDPADMEYQVLSDWIEEYEVENDFRGRGGLTWSYWLEWTGYAVLPKEQPLWCRIVSNFIV